LDFRQPFTRFSWSGHDRPDLFASFPRFAFWTVSFFPSPILLSWLFLIGRGWTSNPSIRDRCCLTGWLFSECLPLGCFICGPEGPVGTGFFFATPSPIFYLFLFVFCCVGLPPQGRPPRGVFSGRGTAQDGSHFFQSFPNLPFYFWFFVALPHKPRGEPKAGCSGLQHSLLPSLSPGMPSSPLSEKRVSLLEASLSPPPRNVIMVIWEWVQPTIFPSFFFAALNSLLRPWLVLRGLVF